MTNAWSGIGAGAWPLVGRAVELAHVTALLEAGPGNVVLVGPAGVGKTRLAGECLELSARAGLVPVRVTATQAAASLPFGAYGPLLPDLVAGTDRAGVLRRVSRAIRDLGEGRRVALLVDDAHLLDEASAALTHQLAAADEVFVLATVRAGEPASDAVVALWKDDLAERLEVGPLSAGDVGEFLAAVLEGPVAGGVAQRFFERSEGNALFLRELVMGALAAGTLRSDGGLWRLGGNLPASARLVELVEARLRGLADEERKALEVLAVWEPMGVEPFERLSGLTDLEPLERQGLIRTGADGRRLKVELAHPLYGEIMRARLSPIRTRALSRAMAETVESKGMRRREDVLRVATWRLQSGGDLDPNLMLAGAREAHARHDLDLAGRLARAAVDAGGGFDAAFLAAQVLNFSGRVREAEAALAALAGQAATDSERGLVAVTRMDNLLYGLGRYDQALRVGEEAEASIADRVWLHEIAARRAAVYLRTHGPQAAAEAAEPVRRDGEGRAFVWASFAAGLGLAKMGRLEDARAAVAEGHAAYRALQAPPLQWPPEFFPFISCEALVHAGRLDEAEGAATDGYRRALVDGSGELQALYAWQLAKANLARGRVDSAARFAEEAAGLFRDLRRRPFLAYALAVLATARALRGEAEAAASALDEIDSVDMPARNIWASEALQARAWAALAAGDGAQARALLETAVSLADRTGDLAGQAAALHQLARVGYAKAVAAELAAVGAQMEGELPAARAAHAAALAADDAPGLEAASAAFEVMGADLFAAEAAADAAVAWRRRGDPRRGASAERRVGLLAARCEEARTPALTAGAARVSLTPRELEIARLAAAGVPNKEIAQRLHLSLHTVQNNLHATYQKLGVAGRAELSEALADRPSQRCG